MQSIINKLRNAEPMQRFGWISIGVIAVFIVSLMIAGVAKAADKGKPKKAAAEAEEVLALPKAAKSWTGCGVGVNAGWGTGAVDLGGPVNLGTEGSTLGGVALCLAQLQQFVAGVEASYDRHFGDPKSLGLNYNMAVTGIVGYAMGNVLPYAHASPWSRIDTDGGKVEGYKFGAGVMFRPADSKLIWDARFSRGDYEDVLGSGLDGKTNEVRLGATYLFQVGK